MSKNLKVFNWKWYKTEKSNTSFQMLKVSNVLDVYLNGLNEFPAEYYGGGESPHLK